MNTVSVSSTFEASEATGWYPRFSDGERRRRFELVEAAMAEHEVACLVVYGDRSSTAVPWLTGWCVTREAAAIVAPSEPVELLVQLYNHVPNARVLAEDAEVRWAGVDTIGSVAEEVRRRAAGRRVGWIGPLSARAAEVLGGIGEVVDLSAAYESMRLVKSAEELDVMRLAAAMTDRSLDALIDAARPGRTNAELVAAIEAAYLGAGGVNHLHFLAVTSMAEPTMCVPAQWPSVRPLAAGDVIVTELSTSYWTYPGQLLRTVTVDSEPTALYRELHDVADAAFDAVTAKVRAGVHVDELVAAADVIEQAGFTIYDDLLHGFGGGYLPPVLRTRGTSHGPVPDMRLAERMTIVVQPNVVTLDHRAGVQTGELIVVTGDGFERLHDRPRGLLSTR